LVATIYRRASMCDSGSRHCRDSRRDRRSAIYRRDRGRLSMLLSRCRASDSHCGRRGGARRDGWRRDSLLRGGSVRQSLLRRAAGGGLALGLGRLNGSHRIIFSKMTSCGVLGERFCMTYREESVGRLFEVADAVVKSRCARKTARVFMRGDFLRGRRSESVSSRAGGLVKACEGVCRSERANRACGIRSITCEVSRECSCREWSSTG